MDVITHTIAGMSAAEWFLAAVAVFSTIMAIINFWPTPAERRKRRARRMMRRDGRRRLDAARRYARENAPKNPMN